MQISGITSGLQAQIEFATPTYQIIRKKKKKFPDILISFNQRKIKKSSPQGKKTQIKKLKVKKIIINLTNHATGMIKNPHPPFFIHEQLIVHFRQFLSFPRNLNNDSHLYEKKMIQVFGAKESKKRLILWHRRDTVHLLRIT